MAGNANEARTISGSPAPELVVGRYRIQNEIGRGGMAAVYHAVDTASGDAVALKRVLVCDDATTQQRVLQLFRDEYHVLSNLAHPHVIEVYNYVTDDAGDYYTMELLDGGDLYGLGVLPWRRACGLMMDICSALSLVHSRRRVHRDLTPRNIRCTKDGRAKLIDFGAIAQMGPCNQVIGTPPCTSPEVVDKCSLDGRSDLYSLGSTLYFALTGKYAYPARRFSQLRDLWRSVPRLPSAFQQDIPPALDTLVMSMIHVNPQARPANAAEVMEKLSAIATIVIDERLVVSQAYLSAPTLVGRDSELLRVRKQIVRGLKRRGGTLIAAGPSGIGRSRILDAAVVEGKLGGATVIRADSRDAISGPWGVARSLARQLLDCLPEVARASLKPHLPVLGHVLPELLRKFEGDAGSTASALNTTPLELASFASAGELRPRALGALRDWFLGISSQCYLVLALDDVDEMDEPSAAFLAILAEGARDSMLVLVVTRRATSEVPLSAGAMRALDRAGARIQLRNLGLQDTESLLSSVFGAVPNLKLLANRIHSASEGNPRSIMHLAQHLVDEGVLTCKAGAWTLPAMLDARDFSAGTADAVNARMESLGAGARRLGQSLALVPDGGFSFEECAALDEHRNEARLLRELDELVSADILSTDGWRYSFRQRGLGARLATGIDSSRKQAMHLKLAKMLAARGQDTLSLGVAQQFLLGNAQERALDAVLAHISAADWEPSRSGISTEFEALPHAWTDTYETLFAACERLGRPPLQRFKLQWSFVTFGSVTGMPDTTHFTSVVAQLWRDSGLDLHEELGDSVEPSQRLHRALELAQQRYDSTPELERMLPPLLAIPALAKVAALGSALASCAADHALVASLPSLKPLIPLSPALDTLDRTIRAIVDMWAGRTHQSHDGLVDLIARIAKPDRGGLDEHVAEVAGTGARYGAGMLAARLGFRSALHWADDLERMPLHEENAWHIRANYYSWQGERERAKQCKKRAELLQIQNSPSQYFEGNHLATEIAAYAAADDFMGVKQTIVGLEKKAERFENWAPTLHFGRGSFERIRGDHVAALSEFERGLSRCAAGHHSIWATLAGALLDTLFALERFDEVESRGRELMTEIEREGAEHLLESVQPALNLLAASRGQGAEAVQSSESIMQAFKATGGTGLRMGAAYENRARIAIYMDDDAAFEHYAALCMETYKAGGESALTAKYERLIRDARRAGVGAVPARLDAGSVDAPTASEAGAKFTELLSRAQGPSERAQCALKVVLRATGCPAGFLYLMQRTGASLSAQCESPVPPANMDTLVADYLSAELEGVADVTMTVAELEPRNAVGGGSVWGSADDATYRPILLSHESDGGTFVTGLAVVKLPPSCMSPISPKTVAALSKALQLSGDVTAALAPR